MSNHFLYESERISGTFLKFFFLLAFFCFYNTGFATSTRYLELADSADYYISKENWEKAEAKILEALRLEPANFTNSLLLSNLGTVQTAKGEYEKALQSFELALAIAPSSVVAYNNRARTFLFLEKFDKALDDLNQSLSLDPNQEWPLQTKGFILLGLNDIDNAEITFEILESKFPENYLAHTGLAAVNQRKENFDQALIEYNKALSIFPEDIETSSSKIFLLIEMKNFSEARSEINKNLSRHPEEPIFYLLRGYLHRLNYRLDEAEADRKIAIDKGIDPEYIENFIPKPKK